MNASFHTFVISKPRDDSASQRGVALVLALSMLAILMVLVVGFSVSARTERQSARSIANNERTDFIAKSALARAIAILQNNIPPPVPPGYSPPTNDFTTFGGSSALAGSSAVNWMVRPGLLTVITSPGASGPVHIPLSTNPSGTYQAVVTDADLNPPRIQGGNNVMFPGNGGLRVAWSSMLRDPAAAASASNPIVGRYAFWIDDESSKINVNTAYGSTGSAMDYAKVTPGTVMVAGVSYPLGYPSSVDLSAISGISRDDVVAAVSAQNGLTSLDSIKPPIVTDPRFIDSHRLDLTAWSRDLEFTVFGKSRAYLIRRYLTNTLGSPLFQRFRDREAPAYFHSDENIHEDSSGTQSNPDPAALYYNAAALAAMLNRADWPGMPARSFVDKWGGGAIGKREADQVAWNTVAMGSFAACSTQDYDIAISATGMGAKYYLLANKLSKDSNGGISTQTGSVRTVNTPNTGTVLGPLSNKALIPAMPRPLLNEICLRVAPETVTVAGQTRYRLKFDTIYELWLPPGYPASDFTSANAATNIGLTYLSYTVSQGSTSATQTDTKYINANDPNGIRTLYGGTSTTPATMNSDSYLQVAVGGIPATGTSPYFYARNGSGFSSSTNGATNFQAGTVTVDVKMRVFVKGTLSDAPLQLVPVWDTRDPGTAVAASQGWDTLTAGSALAAFAPPADDPKDYITFQFSFNPSDFADQIITRSLEVADPRLSGLASAWKSSGDFSSTTTQDIDTLGSENKATAAARSAGMSVEKIAHVDFSNPATSPFTRPPIGLFSCVATGMQRGLPGVGLKLQPSGGSSTELPDWLLLDLLAPTHRAANYSRLSSMNSTAGKINLNAKFADVNSTLLPSGTYYAPPNRVAALTALVTGAGASSSVAQNILDHTLAAGGQDFGAAGEYDYLGEVCEIAGVADTGKTDWEKEKLVRNLAGLMTTRSSVFSVWGVAQSVQKVARNTSYGAYETGDVVTGEKRFQAVVERYLWPGADGVPGNAKTDPSSGNYDTSAQPQSQPGGAPAYTGGAWETIDGPDAPTYPVAGASPGPWNMNAAASYASSPLATAYNPLRAVPKYQVLYFRYLNE